MNILSIRSKDRRAKRKTQCKVDEYISEQKKFNDEQKKFNDEIKELLRQILEKS
jgi:hypothetical protein